MSRNFVLSLINGQRPNYRLELAAPLPFAQWAPQLGRSVRLSKSRIKRLRGMKHPQYRLRVGEIRVFYDVTGNTVEVLAIVSKSEAASWLAEIGG